MFLIPKPAGVLANNNNAKLDPGTYLLGIEQGRARKEYPLLLK